MSADKCPLHVYSIIASNPDRDSSPSSPASRKPTVFVCYAREDSALRERLARALDEHGIEAVGDWLLSPGRAYRDQLELLIERADAFLVLLGTAACESAACREEIDRAETLGKRMIPAVVDSGYTDALIPPSLAVRQWAFLRPSDDWERGIEAVTQAVLTDWDLAAVHSWLTQRAQEWLIARDRRSALLRGTALDEAEAWFARVATNPLSLPVATPLQTDYVAESRRAWARARWLTAGGATLVLLVLAAVALDAVRQRVAERAAQNAAAARALAVKANVVEREYPRALQTQVLLAIESMRRYPTVEANAILRERASLLPRKIARFDFEASDIDMAVSADGRYLAVTRRDDPVAIIDLRTGKQTALPKDRGTAYTVRFAPDGTLLTARDVVTRWTVDGIERQQFVPAAGEALLEVSAEAFVTQRQINSYTSQFTFWSTSTGTRLPIRISPEDKFAVSSDGRTIITPDGDHALTLWDAATGTKRKRVDGTVDAVTRDGRHTYNFAESGTLTINDLETGETIFTVENAPVPESIEVAPTQRLVAVLSSSTVHLWNRSGQEVFRRYAPDLSLGGFFARTRFLPNGKALATIIVSGVRGYQSVQHDSVWLWDVRLDDHPRHDEPNGIYVRKEGVSTDGRTLAGIVTGESLALEVVALAGGEKEHWSDHRGFQSVALCPTANVVASATGDEVEEWDFATDRIIGTLPHPAAVMNVAYSGDGTRLATGAEDDAVYVWQWRTAKRLRRVPVKDMERAIFALSRDGTRLAYADEKSQSVKVVNVADGRLVGEMVIGKVGPRGMVFSTDGDRLLVYAVVGPAILWSYENGRKIASFESEDMIEAAALSADGQFAALGDHRGTVRIWRIEAPREEVRLTTGSPIAALFFRPDGRLLVASHIRDGAGTHGGKVRVVRWRADELIADACARLQRNLTTDEWRRFLPGEPYRRTCPGVPDPWRSVDDDD